MDWDLAATESADSATLTPEPSQSLVIEPTSVNGLTMPAEGGHVTTLRSQTSGPPLWPPTYGGEGIREAEVYTFCDLTVCPEYLKKLMDEVIMGLPFEDVPEEWKVILGTATIRVSPHPAPAPAPAPAVNPKLRECCEDCTIEV